MILACLAELCRREGESFLAGFERVARITEELEREIDSGEAVG